MGDLMPGQRYDRQAQNELRAFAQRSRAVKECLAEKGRGAVAVFVSDGKGECASAVQG